MVKRFTDTNKWDDPWFAELSQQDKLLWIFICDKCNQVGIIDYSQRITEFNVGSEVNIDEFIEISGNRVVRLKSGKLYITKFLDFQVGTVSDNCPAHKPIIKLIKQNPEILEYPIPYPNARVLDSLKDTLLCRVQEKEKEEEIEMDKDKDMEIESIDEIVKPKISKYLEKWNEIANKYDLAEIVESKFTYYDRKLLVQVEKGLTFELLLQVDSEIEQSEFLKGLKSNWKLTFDWLVDCDDNWKKVVKGNYRETASRSAQQVRNAEIDENAGKLIKEMCHD